LRAVAGIAVVAARAAQRDAGTLTFLGANLAVDSKVEGEGVETEVGGNLAQHSSGNAGAVRVGSGGKASKGNEEVDLQHDVQL
jgi:hypothetical protein